MKKMSNSWLTFVIGLLLGLALSLVLILIFREVLFGENHDAFLNKMFGPVFTSIITLIGVIIALGGVYWNIKIQRSLEDERVERGLKAARASLPVALSELVNICKSHVLQIKSQRKYNAREAMNISEYAQETIKEVIKNSDGIIIKKLSNLLACYQIAKSKYGECPDRC